MYPELLSSCSFSHLHPNYLNFFHLPLLQGPNLKSLSKLLTCVLLPPYSPHFKPHLKPSWLRESWYIRMISDLDPSKRKLLRIPSPVSKWVSLSHMAEVSQRPQFLAVAANNSLTVNSIFLIIKQDQAHLIGQNENNIRDLGLEADESHLIFRRPFPKPP